MKLLLDQNLSYKLVADLQAWYPGTSQVRLLGMEQAEDKTVWDHARQHEYAFVTQDSDFNELSVRWQPTQGRFAQVRKYFEGHCLPHLDR